MKPLLEHSVTGREIIFLVYFEKADFYHRFPYTCQGNSIYS